MSIYRGNIFTVDWNSLEAVKAVAIQLAKGNNPEQIVFWNGKNYQITFAEKRGEIEAKGYSVVFQTGGKP